MAAPIGDQRAITSKVASKYDTENEAQIIAWIKELCKVELKPGMKEMKEQLSEGHILIQLINAVYSGTPAENMPGPAAKKKQVKLNKGKMAFAHMENIQNFVAGCESYGVPKTCTFQTVDLYEGRNMPQVLNCIMALGTECQRNQFPGMTIGARPTTKNVREFTDEQMRAGQTVIGLQAGTNKCASQSGMSMGSGRHIADIKVDDMCKDGQGVLGMQAGYNKGASQSGMSFGGGRHCADIKVDDMCRDGQGVLGGQAGYTGGASQSGMSFGAPRHVNDIKVADMCADGQGVLGMQAGYTGGASQSGMSFGATRHINDIKVADMCADGHGVLGMQAGYTGGDSQSGMSFGAPRHINDMKIADMSQDSQGML